jgi:hypothetical protein
MHNEQKLLGSGEIRTHASEEENIAKHKVWLCDTNNCVSNKLFKEVSKKKKPSNRLCGDLLMFYLSYTPATKKY